MGHNNRCRVGRAVGVALLCVLWASVAPADFVPVPVGNEGNLPDTTGYGAVSYAYRIGMYPVTAGEYRDFLNAVDPTGANDLKLYNEDMAKIGKFGCMITWNTAAGVYDFSAKPSDTNEAVWASLPVNFVSWYDAARYANWMTTGDTEIGVYEFENDEFIGVNRESPAIPYGWVYVLPTYDEWYKAAYHDKESGLAATYFDYPMGSDDLPSNVLADPPEEDPGNNANFFRDGMTVGYPYYRTEVGAFMNSASPYGTFDQGGNVWEWTETADKTGLLRAQLGGAWEEDRGRFKTGYLRTNPTWMENDISGFRLASFYYIPEPGTATMLLFGAIAGLLWRRRR